MWELFLITFALMFLVVVSAYLLNQSRARREKCMREALSLDVEQIKELLALKTDVYRSLGSLFNDDDYFWLKNQFGLKKEARTLKFQRIRLAYQYLSIVKEDFNRLLAWHSFAEKVGLVDSYESGSVASIALKFRLKLLFAYFLLPLSVFHFHLEPISRLGMENAKLLFQ